MVAYVAVTKSRFGLVDFRSLNFTIQKHYQSIYLLFAQNFRSISFHASSFWTQGRFLGVRHSGCSSSCHWSAVATTVSFLAREASQVWQWTSPTAIFDAWPRACAQKATSMWERVQRGPLGCPGFDVFDAEWDTASITNPMFSFSPASSLFLGGRAFDGCWGCPVLCKAPHHCWADEHRSDEQHRRLLHLDREARGNLQCR